MRRRFAVIWHASFSIIAAGWYFFFVLPRWWELTGTTSHTLGTVGRIVAAVLIGLAALPVVFTLLRTRKPEYRTPQLALTLLVASIVAHVLAGVLIAGTAISEIWFSLGDAGQWLFGIYGAAAATALLGIGGFYLSFVAELPPRPPKPAKPKKAKQRRRSRKKGKGSEEAAEVEAAEVEAVEVEAVEVETDEAETVEAAETATDETEAEGAEVEAVEVETDEAETVEAAETATGETEAEGAETISEAERAESTVAESDTPEAELVATGGRHRMPTGKRRRKNSD